MGCDLAGAWARFFAGRPGRCAALIAVRNSRCRPAWHANGSVAIDSNGQLCPWQEIQGVGQSLRKRGKQGPSMPEESLRTALVRSVVSGCPRVASRRAFCSLAPPKGWQMRQFVVFEDVSVVDG